VDTAESVESGERLVKKNIHFVIHPEA